MNYRVMAPTLGVALLFSIAAQPSDASLTPTRSVKATLTVFAASSLGPTFEFLGRQFEKAHPGVSVRFSFLASSTLATQLLAGAPADIFASASQTDMVNVESLVPESLHFASNSVVLATPKRNKFHIKKIVDVNRKGVRWIQCAHAVPCGVAADAALSYESQVTSQPVSLEPKVSSVVAKLLAGEVDAAIIYHTDIVANRGVLREVRFSNTQAATTRYFIGAVKGRKQIELAKSFLTSVHTENGRHALVQAGFTVAK